MVGVAFICCTFVAKIKCHTLPLIFNLLRDPEMKLQSSHYQCFETLLGIHKIIQA